MLDLAFAALTADIITYRFYGEHYDCLGIRDFRCEVEEAFLGISYAFNFAQSFPSLVTFFKGLPVPILRLLLPSVADLLTLQEGKKHNLLTLPHRETTAEAKYKSFMVEAPLYPKIPPEERKIDRLLDKTTVGFFAGTETTARAISMTVFHLLNEKSHMIKLGDELKTLPVMQDNAYSLSQLDPLPFLVRPCTIH